MKKILFTGAEKDNSNQLHVIMIFPNIEAVRASGRDEKLTEIRRKAGTVIESSVKTPNSGDYFNIYFNMCMKH